MNDARKARRSPWVRIRNAPLVVLLTVAAIAMLAAVAVLFVGIAGTFGG